MNEKYKRDLYIKKLMGLVKNGNNSRKKNLQESEIAESIESIGTDGGDIVKRHIPIVNGKVKGLIEQL